MVQFYTGIWTDYTRPAGFQQVITLSADHGKYFVSFLTVLVTIASTSAWGILAFLLHSYVVRSRQKRDIFDLQQQIALRNSKTSVGTILEAGKIHRAWSGKGMPGLASRTAIIVIPAFFLWSIMMVASIFSSRVAATNSVLAPAKAHDCGIPSIPSSPTGAVRSTLNNYFINSTAAARNYVTRFYYNSSDSLSKSPYIVNSLHHRAYTSVPCPFTNQSACLGGTNAIQLESEVIDSHSMLGINAPVENRLGIQLNVLCSLINTTVYENVASMETSNMVYYYMGGLNKSDIEQTAWTFSYQANRRYYLIGYQIVSYNNDLDWYAIPDLYRNDEQYSDMSLIILSANGVRYRKKVLDPFFRATMNGPGKLSSSYAASQWISAMTCYGQYRFQNPNNQRFSPWASLGGLQQTLYLNNLSLNSAQNATASRLAYSFSRGAMNNGVKSLGTGALYAQGRVSFNTDSSELPDNQWQLEVQGWFQTKLAKLQASVAEYINPPKAITSLNFPFGLNTSQMPEIIKQMLENQCKAQIVRSSGEIINFSLWGSLCIIILSGLLTLGSMFMAKIMSFAGRFTSGSRAHTARQGDENMHLLRLALSANGYPGLSKWELGKGDIPVTTQREQVPGLEEHAGISFYPSREIMMDTEYK